MLRCVMSCRVVSCPVMSCRVMSCHVTSRHVTSRHVTSHHVTSRYITSRHVTSCYVLSRHPFSCYAYYACRVASCYLTSWHASCHFLLRHGERWQVYDPRTLRGVKAQPAKTRRNKNRGRVAERSAGAKGRAQLLCVPLPYRLYILETSATGSRGYYLVKI